ncbi:MAG TPA: altronate dehydratase family protein [Thermomicrobiales bacterium]
MSSTKPRAEAMTLMSRAPQGPVPLNDVAVLLNPIDDVAIAKQPLLPGTILRLDDGSEVRVSQMIPTGHKVALRPVALDAPVRRYGQIIGFATQEIAPGQHVHTQNLSIKEQGSLKLDYAFCADYKPVELVPESERRTFMGFRRPDGRVGTRNYVAVLASVNCASSATVAIADYFKQPGVMDEFPNVDGVIALPHKGGCGAHIGSKHLALFQRTLAGIVNHPCVAGYVVISLGCEVNQPTDMIESTVMRDDHPLVLTIQQDGGFKKTVEAGIEAVKAILPKANEARREPVPASELVVALQCGGSDGWSGVTANPGLGKAADLLVKQGGTVVLGETTEVYGAEHLLTRRAKSPEVAQKLVDLIRWWEEYTEYFGGTIDNNPAPGNKLGGLTTIYEKSLGAAAKAGSTPLNQVVEYGERVTERGFVHMDTPGYDPVSVTGQVAGGCNLVVFTTGRGSCFGFKPAPSIKIATNSELYARQEDDMDINAGRVLEGMSLDELGQEIFEEMLAVASGKRTKSELAGVGQEEFNPWILGAML